MSDQSCQQAPPNDHDHSVEASHHHPPPLQTYYHQIRSLLGKRDYGVNETSAPVEVSTVAGSSDLATSNSNYPNIVVDDASDFAQQTKNGQGNIFTVDGATDRASRRWAKPVAAIFIHAGAGYHSAANEEHHLKACSEAARVSMKALKGGRSAIEAVEAAIKILENKEITNAGYGSNLAIDGTVECDATVVDHFGRSGACGAVPNVKNPIALARIILETSNKPLSLRRVPPNLLVGEGARDFARDAGVDLVTNDDLISKNSRDRFIRWRDDLRRAEGRDMLTTPSGQGESPPQLDQDPRKEHTNAILTGTWNEGQPDSPGGGSPWLPPHPRSPISTPSPATGTPLASPKPMPERSPLSFLGASVSHKRQRFLPTHSDEYTDDYTGDSSPTPDPSGNQTSRPSPISSYIPPHDGASDEPDAASEALTSGASCRRPYYGENGNSADVDEDQITDTVGAIAIDQSGRMAAGSSSGGIGMKHRGRIGPAALVGVGTAVIPADADDVSVAAVTSGTGEHMATTLASQRCAERIYQGSVRGPDGRDVPCEDESAVLASFIENDFLGHPGVRESASPGAIGAMAVKKAPGGYYLYFAHNTESFALASMGSNDASPACVMSRIHEGGGGVAQGARKIRT
ncbi:nucleophile aminohydrolase [Nemania sp. FL0031]|nr:nucleophile aminohydrolase [Nemania sp. FL0031]